jgi:mRNA interferase MazF
VKGYPFEVVLPEGGGVKGVVLADQVKNLDWSARRAAFHERAPESVLDDVLEKLSVLIG